MKETFKPMPFSVDLPLAFAFLSISSTHVSFSLQNVVEYFLVLSIGDFSKILSV